MSKFFITNKKSILGDIRKRVEESSFEICYSKEGEISCLTTKKLAVEHINGIDKDNGFITVTGTMIWGDGNRVDGDIINKISEIYDGDINSIRKLCVGNYAVSVADNEKGCVFSDLSGFYDVYYFCQDNSWVISNSLYDLYIVLKSILTLDNLSIVEMIRQYSILNGDTPFHEIKRLRGFDYIKFDKNNIELIEEDHPYPLAKGTFDENVEKYVSFSKSYAEKTYKAYGTPTIAMTGGLDARMLLASYLSIGVKPDLYYGTGDTFITNTIDQDKFIDRQYSKKFDLKLYEESWKTPEPMDKYWEKYLEIFGFNYDVYASSNDVMESVINNPNNYFILGEGGEMLRNQTWIDERNKDYFTIDEYLEDFYVPQDIKDSIVDVDSYMQRIRKKYLDICRYYQIDPCHIASEDIFLLTLERRKTADSVTMNWMNLIRYDSIQMIQYEGLLSARLGYKDTSNARFMLYCQEKLFPEVLDIPIFSHCKMRKFNRDRMMISERFSFKRAAKTVIKEVTPSVFTFIRKNYHKDQAHSTSKNTLVFNRTMELYNILNKSELFHIDKFTDQRSLVRYVMFLNAINKK